MHRAVWFVVALCACSEETVPQSRAIQRSTNTASGRVEMSVGPDGPPPVGVAELQKRFPAWQEMAPGPLEAAASAVNLVPGPCAECEGLPLAHCATKNPQQCPVASKIAARARRFAEQGMPTDELKVALNYPDLWFADMGEGIPVTVHLYRDEDGPFAAETRATQQVLSERFQGRIAWTVHNAGATPAENLGVRSRPTWFINGHRFRGAQTSRTLGRFINFELLDGAP